MSKKSRKNSSKSASGRQSAAKPAASTKTGSGKTRTSAARKNQSTAKRAASKSAPAKANPKSAPTSTPKSTLKSTVRPTGPGEGTPAPSFTLPRDGGSSVALQDFLGKKLVLFFYPRADTPGCTREAIDFTRLADAFAASGTVVLGISSDSRKAQEAFRDKHKLAVPLISDEAHEMLEAYGAWGEKSMYGRTFLGILRTTVLIDADGRIARVWRNVRVDGHAEEVLAAAQAL